MRGTLRAILVVSAAFAIVLIAGRAFADSPDPAKPFTVTSASNADGSVTVSVSGSWVWPGRPGPCQPELAGYNIDWNDPDQAGNVVASVQGVTIDVGARNANARNPADNEMHAALCGPAIDHPSGTWGPISHTYEGHDVADTVCVVTYHRKAKEHTAGGSHHNRDNSIEENDNIILDDFCVPVVPPAPELHVVKRADSPTVVSTQPAGFTITVSNTGQGAAYDVTISDLVPVGSGLSWSIDATTGSPTCGIAAGTLTCSASTVAGGGTYSVHITSPTTFGTCDHPIDNTVVMRQGGVTVGQDDETIDVLCPPPGLFLNKSGPALTHVGETITYTFGVANVNGPPLHGVMLTDPMCDSPATRTGGDDNSDDVLQSSEVWTFSCSHVVTANDADPLVNTATASAKDPANGDVHATASQTADILHPEIAVTKTPSVTSGKPDDPVTFTYVVTNPSSDTPLMDVAVVDDILGSVGTIAKLEAGASVTFEVTSHIDGAHRTNVATATGADALGKSVSAQDTVTLTVVQGVKITKPLPRTGVDSTQAAGIALLLMAFMLTVVVREPRRRTVVRAEDDRLDGRRTR